jgi:hypothetical protein
MGAKEQYGGHGTMSGSLIIESRGRGIEPRGRGVESGGRGIECVSLEQRNKSRI